MKNSMMKRYKPQMILFLIIIIEAIIMLGLIQHRNYIEKKQAEEASRTAETNASQENASGENEGETGEELTTLALADIPERSADDSADANEQDGVRIVCIDAALGGYAKGNTSDTDSGMSESEYNLEFAQLMKQKLNEKGILVYMTREDNDAVDEEDRTDLANNVYADLMITLTRDSYDGTDQKSGVTAWVHHKRPQSSDDAANLILEALEDAGARVNTVDAGTAESTADDYYTNENCIGPSLVLGMGSVKNENDITDYEENKEIYAEAVAQAIVDWMEDQGL